MSISLPASPAPTIATAYSTDTGMVADRTDDGATKLRDLYAATQYEVRLQWDSLEIGGKDLLDTFFEVNKAAQIDAVVSGKTYRGKVIKSPDVSFDSSQNLYKLSVTIRGPRV